MSHVNDKFICCVEIQFSRYRYVAQGNSVQLGAGNRGKALVEATAKKAVKMTTKKAVNRTKITSHNRNFILESH